LRIILRVAIFERVRPVKEAYMSSTLAERLITAEVSLIYGLVGGSPKPVVDAIGCANESSRFAVATNTPASLPGPR
jgi:hypothetical protein